MENSPATAAKPQRLKSPDVIKGLIITVIIVFHILFQQEKNLTTGETSVNIVLQGFYTGLMVFFIISGYFFRPGRSYKENTMKRVVQLGLAVSLCIIILPLILYGYLILCGQPVPFSDYYEYSLVRLFGPNNMFQPFTLNMDKSAIDVFAGYYFLQTMLVGFIIFYAIADKVIADRRKLVAAIVILLGITWLFRAINIEPPYFLAIGFTAAGFMLVGAALGRAQVIEYLERMEVKTKKYWINIIIAAVVAVVMIAIFPPGNAFYATYFGTYSDSWGLAQGASVYPYFITSCAVGYLIMAACAALSKVPYISTLLSTLGKHTLAILLLHEFLAKMIIAPFYTLSNKAAYPEMPMYVGIPLCIVVMAIGVAVGVYGPRLIGKLMAKKSGKPETR